MNLSGLVNLRFLVDSGFWNVVDATLRPTQMRTASDSKMVTPTSLFVGFQVFSCEKLEIGRESYKDLFLGALPVEGKDADGAIGFRFLARHVVTFDFPNRVLYFKQNTSR